MTQVKRTSVLKDDWRFLALLVLLGCALRLDFLFANRFTIDADEAIVGIMAADIVNGLPVPTFYYGQHYMGSFEPLVVAAGFALFGLSSVVLKCVPLLFSLLFILLVYALAHEVAGRAAARLAAILCAVPPSPLMVWSSMARGGFIEVVVIGALALYLTIRWIKNAKPPPLHTFVIGAVIGFGWWVNNQIIYFMPPIAVFLAARLLREKPRGRSLFTFRDTALHLVGGVAGFFAGGFPFWKYNFENNFASFGIFGRAGSGDVLENISGLFGTSIPMLLGGKRFWAAESIFPYASLAVIAVYALLLLYLVMVRMPHIGAVAGLKIDRDQPIELFLLFAATCLIVFPLSSFGWLVEAPRYLLPLYISIFVLSGAAVVSLSSRFPPLYPLLAAVLVGLNLVSCYWHGRAIPGEPFVYGGERVSKDHSDLIEWLEERNVEFVRTNYWIGYRLAFETAENVRVALFGAPDKDRIPEWSEVAEQVDPKEIPYVLVPSQAAIVRKALLTLGYHFEEARLSGYVVLFNVVPRFSNLKRVSSARLVASSDYNGQNADKAVDGSEKTRWGSAHPQLPGMTFSVRVEPPVLLRGMRYDLGQWKVSDYPRGLEIEAELADGSHRTLISRTDYGAVRYFDSGIGRLELFWEPMPVRSVKLTQTGEDKIFDWSIAELRLFE